MDWPGIFKPELCTDYKLWPAVSAVRGLQTLACQTAVRGLQALARQIRSARTRGLWPLVRGLRPIQTRNLPNAFMQA